MLNYAAIVKLHDQVSGPAKQAGAAVQRMSGQIQSAQQKISMMQRVQMGAAATTSKLQGLFAVAAKVSAVTGVGMGAAAASATNISAKYEDLGAVFETLEGSSQKAQQSLAWVKKFTIDTPYELDATATAFGRLRAYGIDPMDGTLTTLGDTAAAMGKDVMAAVEMMADAVVGENERLKEFGIRASTKGNKITYSYKDKSGKQQRKTVNKDDQDEIRRSLNAIFNEKYAGAMEKRSKTFNGILSNVKDTVAGLQAQFMQGGLFEGMKNGLQNRLDKLTALSESGKVEQMGKKAAAVVNTVTHAVGNITSTVSAGAQKLANFVGGWKNLAIVASSFGGWWLLKDLFLAVAGGISVGHIAVLGLVGAMTRWQTLLPRLTQHMPAIGAWLESRLPDAIFRFKAAANTLKEIWNGNEYWGGNRLQQFRNIFAIAFGVDPIKKFGAANQWLRTVGTAALDQYRDRLPLLQSQAKTVLSTVANWFKTNSKKIQTVLTSVAGKALEKFATLMDWLSVKAKDGSMSRWLDSMLAKVQPAIANVMAFGRGLWVAGAAIAAAVIYVKDLVGGWENFGKLVAGLAVLTIIGPVIAALAATATLVFALGQIAFATGSTVLRFGLWLQRLGVFSSIAARATALFNGAMSLLGRVLPIVGRAILFIGRALLMNPIGLLVTAIAVAAYLIYANWSKIVNWWNNSKLKAQVMPIATAALDYAKSKWEQLKNWWNTSTLTQKALGIATATLQIAWTLAKDFFNWWLTTELGQKSLKIATDAIDWARAKVQTFLDWWNGLSLKSITASIQSSLPSWMGGSSSAETKQDGARALGGPVRAGGLYEVAERAPEIYRQGNRAWVIANGARGGQVINMQRYRDDREASRTATRIPSAQASMGRVATEMRGLHELTVNLRTAPGTSATVEQKRTSGNVSKFNLGKQGGAAL